MTHNITNYEPTFQMLIKKLDMVRPNTATRDHYALATQIMKLLDGREMADVMLSLGLVMTVIENASPPSKDGTMPFELLLDGVIAYTRLLETPDDILIKKGEKEPDGGLVH